MSGWNGGHRTSLPRDRFGQVQERPADGGPRGQFRHVGVLRQRGDGRSSAARPRPSRRPCTRRGSSPAASSSTFVSVSSGRRDGDLPEREREALRVGLAALERCRCAEHAGRLDERRVVEQHERGERRVRPRPLGGALLARRGVERLEHRVQVLPLPVDVDAAPPLLRVGVGGVLALREVQVPVEARPAGTASRSGRRRRASSSPLTNSALSRMLSAGSRHRPCRASSRFSGSRSRSAGGLERRLAVASGS